jgi:hypothetical protein
MTAAETTKQRYRTAGELTLMSPEPDAAKAEAYLERALAIARSQQAKSWDAIRSSESKSSTTD